MPNKDWNRLDKIDRQIRRLSPNKGMTAGTEPQVRVTLIRGFELFNTRPYHNHDTWSDGYVAEAFGEGGKVIAKASAEDLDDAIRLLAHDLESSNREAKEGVTDD